MKKRRVREETMMAGMEDMSLPMPYREPFREEFRDPTSTQEVMQSAREWERRSLFLREGLKLKLAFHNYGFRVMIPRATNGQKADLESWWQDRGPEVKEFGRETWRDWFLMDNGVGFWRDVKDALPSVLLLRPERCEFKDPMGVESLRVRMEWKTQDFKVIDFATGKEKLLVDQKTIDRFGGKRMVTVDPAKGEHFKVLRRERKGYGFAFPGIYSLFTGLKTMESMEVVDEIWAFCSRLVIRQFRMGHEIKTGPMAGHRKNMWNKALSDEVIKFFEGRLGAVNFTSNFDLHVEYPFPSLDRFDKKKYEGVLQRMGLWLGPVGSLILNQGANGTGDTMMRMLKTSVAEERETVGPFLNAVIRDGFKAPKGAEVRWSNKVFADSRMAMELTKTLLASGPLSQRTALEEGGFDAEEERERKVEEGELAPEATLPIFDPAHGKRPGEPSGRPVGAKG